jgi:hypothetical protein
VRGLIALAGLTGSQSEHNRDAWASQAMGRVVRHQRAALVEMLKFRPGCDDEHGRGVWLPELERR